MQIIILELSLFFKVLTAKLAAGHRLFIWVLKRFETSSSVGGETFQMGWLKGPYEKANFQ